MTDKILKCHIFNSFIAFQTAVCKAKNGFSKQAEKFKGWKKPTSRM
jgi:hypothetical protein